MIKTLLKDKKFIAFQAGDVGSNPTKGSIFSKFGGIGRHSGLFCSIAYYICKDCCRYEIHQMFWLRYIIGSSPIASTNLLEHYIDSVVQR